MGEVVELDVVTTLDIDPDRVLNKAIGELDRVVVVGFTKDGSEYFASSVADGAEVTWMLERAKYKLMKIVD